MTDIVFDDSPAATGDSSMNLGALNDPNVLKVYKTGELTVVGFGGNDVPDEICIAVYREQLFKMIDEYQCKVMSIDLTGVTLVPSGMLGVLNSLRTKVERVELYNPSVDVREVLRMTHLDQLFVIKDIAFE